MKPGLREPYGHDGSIDRGEKPLVGFSFYNGHSSMETPLQMYSVLRTRPRLNSRQLKFESS